MRYKYTCMKIIGGLYTGCPDFGHISFQAVLLHFQIERATAYSK